MGRRDYVRREPKKAKKRARQAVTTSILTTTVNVQVINKGKKREGDQAEE